VNIKVTGSSDRRSTILILEDMGISAGQNTYLIIPPGEDRIG
jgi:hypothetical protein